jgi:hypothetical protein
VAGRALVLAVQLPAAPAPHRKHDDQQHLR